MLPFLEGLARKWSLQGASAPLTLYLPPLLGQDKPTRNANLHSTHSISANSKAHSVQEAHLTPDCVPGLWTGWCSIPEALHYETRPAQQSKALLHFQH